MKSKTWLSLFPLTVALVLAPIAAINLAIDPFGAFGDPVLDWHEYNFAQNPRLAKINYLDTRSNTFDSYILGGSTMGSLPTEKLNAYTGSDFFNLFGFNADMYRTRLMAEYVLDNYSVKNLLLGVSLTDGRFYHSDTDTLSLMLPARVSGASSLAQTTRYLLASPKFSDDKLAAFSEITYLKQYNYGFDATTGAYDNTRYDVQYIGPAEVYLRRNTDFAALESGTRNLPYIDDCMADVAAIAAICREKAVNLLVVLSPFYEPYLQCFPAQQRYEFLRKLAAETDFWDFSLSSVSLDPRYFYDPGHFRTPVGAMMLARIYGDETLYCPPDFGAYVTADNVEAHIADLAAAPTDVPHEVRLPVIDLGRVDERNIPKLESLLAALDETGWEAVTFSQAVDYVTAGAALPENPVVLAFEGESWRTDARILDALETHGMRGDGYVTGPAFGKAVLDGPEAKYIEAVRSAIAQDPALGKEAPAVYAHPKGEATALADALLIEAGVRVTLSDTTGDNTLVRGLPQTLIGMRRHPVDWSASASDLIAALGGLG